MIEELESKVHGNGNEFVSPRHSENNNGKTPKAEIQASYPYLRDSHDPYHPQADRPPSFRNMQKSSSINSLGSALSLDKRSAMERFNKMTAATVGMMSNYMDYQSLNNYSRQVVQLT
jgi:hypothetical protein